MRIRSRWVLGVCGLAISMPAASMVHGQEAPQGPPNVWGGTLNGQPDQTAPDATPAGAPPITLEHTPVDAPTLAPGPAPAGTSGMLPTWGSPRTGSTDAPNSQHDHGVAATAVDDTGDDRGVGPNRQHDHGVTPTEPPKTVAHHHHGLFGRWHCIECQRARAKERDGVDVPPPPGYPGGAPLPTTTMITVPDEGVMEMEEPGHAVVGGPDDTAGYAVVNDVMPAAEPTPIGLARGSRGPAQMGMGMGPGMGMMDPRMAASGMRRPGMGAGAGPRGSYDASVRMTSVPPPPAPMGGPGHNRPHIISHMLRLPILGTRHQERVEHRREMHAAEAYGNLGQRPVNDLPASAVYGRR